jgi:hypothetical protein
MEPGKSLTTQALKLIGKHPAFKPLQAAARKKQSAGLFGNGHA